MSDAHWKVLTWAVGLLFLLPSIWAPLEAKKPPKPAAKMCPVIETDSPLMMPIVIGEEPCEKLKNRLDKNSLPKKPMA